MSLLERIKQRGYWEVAIRPVQFKERRVEKLTDLAKIAVDSPQLIHQK